MCTHLTHNNYLRPPAIFRYFIVRGQGGVSFLFLLSPSYIQWPHISTYAVWLADVPLIQFSYQKSQCLIEISVCRQLTHIKYLRALNRVIIRKILQIQFITLPPTPACSPNGMSSDALLIVISDQEIGLKHIIRYGVPRMIIIHEFNMLK